MTNKERCEKLNISLVAKGVVIGATMLVPGISGGTMAMILGIYGRLISSVSSFTEHKSLSIKFLAQVAAGGIFGMFLFSKPILMLIGEYTMPAMYFFMGAVTGSVPMILGKSKLEHFSIRGTIYVLTGIFIVSIIAMLPADVSEGGGNNGRTSFLFLLIAGLIAAAALVLPGISVSYLLLVIGLYDETMMAISELYMAYLLPLAIGLIVGVISVTKILERAMESFPQPAYLIILGFVLGSVTEIYPGIPSGLEAVICIITFLSGGAGILFLTRKGKN